MGTNGLTPAAVVSRLRDARDHARWVPDPGYSIVRDALFDQDPERVAILRALSDQPDGVTFGEIQQTVRRVAGALRARGVGRGDRVAMYLDPSQAAAEVVCGVLAAGAVILPIPKLLGGLSVTHRLRDAGAATLVTDAAGVGRLLETRARTAGVTILTVDSSSSADLLDEARRAEPVEPYQPAADEPALLMYTSGTSGNPKGITHANRVLLGHAGVDFAFELFQADDVYYGTADWGWIGGLMLGLLVPWSFGVPVVALRQKRFDPAETLAIFERYGVTTAFLPPSVLRLLAAHEQQPRRRLRAVVTGGEPAGAAEMAWARRHLAAAVNKAFGQTEANALIGDSAVLGSVDDSTMGAPYPGHVIRLLDEAGEEVAADEVGEIALALPDPVAMLGVWNAELRRPVRRRSLPPDRGPGAPGPRSPAGVPRPLRRRDQEPGLPDRARRDRAGAEAAPVRRGRSRRRRRRSGDRAAYKGVRATARCCAGCCAGRRTTRTGREHGRSACPPPRDRIDRTPAADGDREAAPPGAAGPGLT